MNINLNIIFFTWIYQNIRNVDRIDIMPVYWYLFKDNEIGENI